MLLRAKNEYAYTPHTQKENKQQEVCELTVPFSSFFCELVCQAAYKIHPLHTKVFGLRLKVHPAYAKKRLKNSRMVHRRINFQILQFATGPNGALSCLYQYYYHYHVLSEAEMLSVCIIIGSETACCNIWLFTSPFMRIYAHICRNYKPSMGSCSYRHRVPVLPTPPLRASKATSTHGISSSVSCRLRKSWHHGWVVTGRQ